MIRVLNNIDACDGILLEFTNWYGMVHRRTLIREKIIKLIIDHTR